MSPRLPIVLLALCASLSAAPKFNDYALILDDPPLARRIDYRTGLQSSAARDHLHAIEMKQNSLRRELQRRKLEETGSVRTLVNAIFVRVSSHRAAELKSIPGVASVVYLPPMHRHLDRAVALTRVPSAWTAVGGVDNAGAGVKIAVIDSGIDQNHAAFQDAALSIPSGFPKGDASFTNRKVIVARSYVSQLGTADDNSPRDRVGHGTAIAMIAAGERNTGPLATITGVAPKAWLGNYKIYGSPGINDRTSGGAMIQALEDALSDGMDIAALATGDPALSGPLDRASGCAASPPVSVRPYIPSDACDIRAQAVENAVRMGLTVVVSAGDDGAGGLNFPTLGTVDTPGTASSAITVGATTNSHRLFSRATVAGLQPFDAAAGEGPKLSAPVTAPLRAVSQLGNDGLACTALNAGSLNGAIAFIQRGTCSFDVKVNNAQKAGAVAVLLYRESGSDTLFAPTNLGDTAIPLFLIGNSAGNSIQTFLRSNSGATATLDSALHAIETAPDIVADFSSRGPVIGTFEIKPEIVAPGMDLYTATQTYDPNGDLYDRSGYTGVSGTSFAVPLVAGAVALVKQAHTGYGPAQLKSAVVNTADANVQDSLGSSRVSAIGAGKLNAGAAVSSGATVNPSTLSFGVITSGALPINRTLSVTNGANAAATLSVTASPRDADNNARVGVSPATLSLGPGQSGSVTVQLTGTRPNPGSYEGQINISGNGTNLHVPYLYLVGDGIARNIFAVAGDGIIGPTNESGDLIGFRLVDRYGVPVTNATVNFRTTSGGGKIDSADSVTDIYGIAAGFVILGSQPGDQIFTAGAAGLTQEFNLTAATPPVVASVVDAASFQSSRALAPGSYITIAGSNLSNAARSFVTPYLPISLAGVTVTFDAAGISVPGRVSFVSDSQVNVQIPWELQGQSSASIKVSVNGITSAVTTVRLADSAPAAFEFTDAAGPRLAAALDQGGQVVTSAHPVQRGQAISLYANGLGPVSNQPASGEPGPAQPLASSRVTPVVTVGGRPAQVLFSGLAPGFVGLYQINLVVPADAPSGIQPVVITANGIDSKVSNLSLN